MKKFLFTVLLAIPLLQFSQEDIKLNKKNGIEVSYQLLLSDEGKKKDQYILIANAINTTSKDFYYSVPLIKGSNGKYTLSPFGQEKGFTKVKVRNSTGLFGDGQSIIGELTKMFTVNKHVLFVVKKGETYSEETKFKVKKGVKPLITNTFSKVFKDLSDFDLEISKEMLDGSYTSSCGDFILTIEANENVEKGDFLIQTVNGKKFIWLRDNNLAFKREDVKGYSIIYNKENLSFKYSANDGVKCNWVKN